MAGKVVKAAETVSEGKRAVLRGRVTKARSLPGKGMFISTP